MVAVIIKAFDFMKKHRLFYALSFIFITALLLLLLLKQSYKEDISDFLPLNNKYNSALKVYQDISGANRIIAIFQNGDSVKSDPDISVQAIDDFVEALNINDKDHQVRNLLYQIDYEQVSEVSSFVYQNIPYFLNDNDYARIDSLMATDKYVEKQIASNKQMLMFPMSEMMSEKIQHDPLNLFSPVLSKLQNTQSGISYENYNGYIFSPDMKWAFVIMESPYGSSETEKNTQLLSLLNLCADSLKTLHPDVNVHFIGGPVIAVGNSSQIKSDSIFSVTIAIILIVGLLFVVFRNFWNICLIVLSIGWGWLFAMGALALVHDNISVIVVGISSVILGIAVNYPLHLIAHLQHTSDIRSALKEIVMPLVVGNITTVGAFIALVPLKSIALRDLGLFSSFLLIGAILFVLLYLPHLVKVSKKQNNVSFLDKISNIKLEKNRWAVISIVGLTVLFSFYSLDTSFDSDITNINYMTKEQKKDMEFFKSINEGLSTSKTLYVVSNSSNIDDALTENEKIQPLLSRLKEEHLISGINSCNQFLCSRKEQERRIMLWNKFVRKYSDKLTNAINTATLHEGFQKDSFSEFFRILQTDYNVKDPGCFDILTSTVLSSHVSIDSINKSYSIVNSLQIVTNDVDSVIDRIENVSTNVYAFDVQSMNSSIATRLSDDFNYIGWACGLIVFLFLWFSLGSIELAMLSFLPMAVSWIWILGIMSLLGIQFNVVNIILATFIFGQGDDYTIFMTEGCQYEYAYRRKMLSSYKNSIIISALIMFIGIGALIIGKHPALKSLAEVTIVGMLSVVLMAYVFPPLIFNWLVTYKGKYRLRPVTLITLLRTIYCGFVFFVQLASVYLMGFVLFVVFKPNKKTRCFFHQYVKNCFWFDLNHIPSVKFDCDYFEEDCLVEPSIVICNHQSMLDSAILMALSSKIIIVANEHASHNWVIRQVFKWMDFYTIKYDDEIDELKLHNLINEGYSIAIFPEGERNPESSIIRFHKGAFYLAEKFKTRIVPIIIHGVNHVFPRNTLCTYSGTISVKFENKIYVDSLNNGMSYVDMTKYFHNYYVDKYNRIKQNVETANYYANFVSDRYRYKGVEISSAVNKRLKQYRNYAQWIDSLSSPLSDVVFVLNGGLGEFPLLLALVKTNTKVISIEKDRDKAEVAAISADNIAKNLVVMKDVDDGQLEVLLNENSAPTLFLMEPSEKERFLYSRYNPIIIER